MKKRRGFPFDKVFSITLYPALTLIFVATLFFILGKCTSVVLAPSPPSVETETNSCEE